MKIAAGTARGGARSIRLRPLTAGDRARVEEIIRAAGLFREDELAVALEVFDTAVAGMAGEDTHHPTQTPGSAPADMVAGEPDYTLLGADFNAKLVGWICWGPTPCTIGTYDLYWMAVDPAAQHAGIGTALITEMEHRLAGRARLIVVETAGRPDYRETRTFYKARGYHAAAIIPDFYAPGDDQVVFVKTLRHSRGAKEDG